MPISKYINFDIFNDLYMGFLTCQFQALKLISSVRNHATWPLPATKHWTSPEPQTLPTEPQHQCRARRRLSSLISTTFLALRPVRYINMPTTLCSLLLWPFLFVVVDSRNLSLMRSASWYSLPSMATTFASLLTDRYVYRSSSQNKLFNAWFWNVIGQNL